MGFPHSRFESVPQQNHRKFQKAVRKFFDEEVYEDAQAREEDGKRPSQSVIDKMAYVLPAIAAESHLTTYDI